MESSDEIRQQQAMTTVNNYVWWSMGAGLIPVPFVDLAAVSGVQLKMLADLSRHYHIEFSESRGKAIIGSLLGYIVPNALSWGTTSTILKVIPGVGGIMGGVSMAIFSGASGYALGKVFVQHYESGGTLLTFDPEKVRDYYQQSFEEGKELAEELKRGKKAKTP